MLSVKVREQILRINFNNGINYCIPFNVFLDENEEFYDLCDERGCGKTKYLNTLQQMIDKCIETSIFVIVYDSEGDDFIYSNDVYIITALEAKDIENIFYEYYKSNGKYISPTEINQIEGKELSEFFTHNYIISIVDDNVILNPIDIKNMDNNHIYLLSWD